MGKYRSRSGCLTCRARRVKCDEIHPVCKACSKKNRPCQWEAPHTKFKDYQPNEASSSRSAVDGEDEENIMDVGRSDDEQSQASRSNSPRATSARTDHSRTESRSPNSTSAGVHSPGSSNALPISRIGSSSTPISVASLLRAQVPPGTRHYSLKGIPLTNHEARLVHHYSEHLGRWLDCTDATRQFTLGVPEKVKHCPVLCHAVLSFAARHRREDATAETAYQRCIALLIDRLNEDAASHDETLLCAIVILRFYEQLNVPSATGSDDEQHLAGTSAILRASQGNHYVDPSAPTLREAAFWVYVRQCLYTATINQQQPDIDFSLQLHPKPESMRDSHPLARLRLETAWSNQMTWNTALAVNFCFEGSDPKSDRTNKIQRWQEIWDLVQQWAKSRPIGFEPIWHGPANDNGSFPDIWFTADWHAVAFGFFHFSCILLLSFKPGPRFAIRTVGRLLDVDRQVLTHARAICGACKSHPEIVPLSIILCHTIFIWGPLLTDPDERSGVIQLLQGFELNHIWPTIWIINALKSEWGIE